MAIVLGLDLSTQSATALVLDTVKGTTVARARAAFGADFPDDEYDTVGGLVTSAIGHLPEAGEELALGRFHFRVGRADRRRVQSFVVSVNAAE